MEDERIMLRGDEAKNEVGEPQRSAAETWRPPLISKARPGARVSAATAAYLRYDGSST